MPGTWGQSSSIEHGGCLLFALARAAIDVAVISVLNLFSLEPGQPDPIEQSRANLGRQPREAAFPHQAMSSGGGKVVLKSKRSLLLIPDPVTA